ncbi:hypothetical protein M1O54_00850 [Dehalococcoidia bacterium]|nr:hypothetical protein [Dehalococcoidia bacterium]
MEEKVEFIRYAQLQMQEREINDEDVLDTLKSPGQILIITVYWTSKIEKYWR